MGADLYTSSPAAHDLFDQADQQLGFSLSSLCFQGPEDELTRTLNQQPALFVTSLATLAAMHEHAWADPAYVAGHSLGELSALVAAGSISFADGLRLVRRRGELMEQAGAQSPGAMAAILALTVEQVNEVCDQASQDSGQLVQVANDNCPGQVVISGDAGALDVAMTLAANAGARKVVKLPITIAAHSPLMASANEAFAAAVDQTPIAAPRIPVVGNVRASLLSTPAEIREELRAQLTAAVQWTATITLLGEQGVDTFVEVGPGDVLLGLVKRINRKATRHSFSLPA